MARRGRSKNSPETVAPPGASEPMMNILTHGLASLALARAAWPRAPKQLWIVAVASGVIADIDSASAWWGASAWLRWHRTYIHSLLASLIIAAAFAAGYRLMADDFLRGRFSVKNAFAMALAAGWLHLFMDVWGWEGTAVLWPFSAKRLAMDLVVDLDPWIIAVLLGALLVPELLHLVSAEIGARDTRPRGRTGALVGFAIIVFYLGLRAYFHGDVIALLDSRTFQGEVAKRTGAFPEALSPVTWHGVVETARGMRELTVIVGPVESFDPESADAWFKPEPSAALEAAEKAEAARRFLAMARFPKASVENTGAGSRVEIRDLRYVAVGETGHEVIAVIRLDTANRVVTDEIAWASQGSQEWRAASSCLRRLVAQNHTRQCIADGDEQDYDDGYLQLVLGQVRQSVVTVAHRQIADGEVAQDAGDGYGQHEAGDGNFETSGSENKYLERRGRREQRRD